MRKPKQYTEEEVERLTLFSGNLRFIINNRPISAAEIARRTGIDPSMVRKYARGRALPGQEQIEKIANALDCTVDDLLDDAYAPWKFGERAEEECL